MFYFCLESLTKQILVGFHTMLLNNKYLNGRIMTECSGTDKEGIW